MYSRLLFIIFATSILGISSFARESNNKHDAKHALSVKDPSVKAPTKEELPVAGSQYDVDVSHSNVMFEISHMVSRVSGSFKDFSGTFSFDVDNPEKSQLDAVVKAASIDTNDSSKKRDTHLRSGDFFDTKKYPTIKFKSKKFEHDSGKKYKMIGDLTLRDVTKEVTFDVELLGEVDDPWGNHRVGFKSTTQINRKEFGMVWNSALDKGGVVLGEEVTINLNIEAIRKKK